MKVVSFNEAQRFYLKKPVLFKEKRGKEFFLYKKVITVVFILVMSLCFAGADYARASRVDVLINKLVDKGILSKSEAKELIGQMVKEAEREKKKVEEVATAAAKATAGKSSIKLPGWVDKLTFKGDLRLRYQGHETEPANPANKATHRSRGRYRLRLGMDAQINPQWKVGTRLASGALGDPRSTNETMGDAFDMDPVTIDRAYASYKPFKWVELTGGKIKNPIWKTKDLLWDGDINPEGVAAKFKYKPMDNLEVFATPAFLLLTEAGGSTDDATVSLLQAGLKWKFAKNMYLKFAPTYYATDNMQQQAVGGLTGSAGTNTADTLGNHLFEYNSVAGDIELAFDKVSGPVPFVALFGQYVVSNADDAKRLAATGAQVNDDYNTGYLAGIKFGHKKVKGFGQWQAKFNVRELEMDAWPDFLSDSDFYGGATNAEGWEAELAFGLHKNVTLGLDYYKTKLLYTAPGALSDREQDLLQVDLVIKY